MGRLLNKIKEPNDIKRILQSFIRFWHKKSEISS